MRQLLIMIISSLLITNSFSQKTNCDKLINNGIFIKSQWGIKFEIEGLLHQKLNQDFVKNKLVTAGGFSVFYKKFFLNNEVYTVEFSPIKEMHFDNKIFDNTAEFISINFNTVIGYSYNYNNNWGSDFRIGVNLTDIDLKNSEEINEVYMSNFVMGVIVGISLDRYIKLKDFKYLVLGLGIDYYSTNYQSISSNLNRSSMNYSLTIGYKFWFSKKIDN